MKVMLIDGNSLTYRAFFALPTDLTTASGQVTNAVYGFTSMLINLVRDQQPDQVVVAFDRPEPTFRHQALDTYKANRSEAPDILRQQMGLVRQVVDALALPVVERAGFEADDLIATLSSEGRAKGYDVVIVTGDRDSFQLVAGPATCKRALQQARRVGLRPLRRGRHLRPHRCDPRRSTCSTPRCAAIRPTTCPGSPA